MRPEGRNSGNLTSLGGTTTSYFWNSLVYDIAVLDHPKMPIRKIKKNYRNVTGIFASTKAVGEAQFESTLERDFLRLLEFSPDVARFEVQLLTLQAAWLAKAVRYNLMLRDFDDPPGWYRPLVGRFSDWRKMDQPEKARRKTRY